MIGLPHTQLLSDQRLATAKETSHGCPQTAACTELFFKCGYVGRLESRMRTVGPVAAGFVIDCRVETWKYAILPL
jgi:hypothetical protein